MRRGSLIIALAFVVVAGLPAGARARDPDLARGGIRASANFELVGHHALLGRGMNAALAIYRNFLYVGSRTDASDTCVPAAGVPRSGGCPHERPNVLILDIADPAHPRLVGEIGPPHEGVVGLTSRELRVWPQEKLLIVMNITCGAFYGACGESDRRPNIRFYDISGPSAANPQLVSTYRPSVEPHEMFLWIDPQDPARAFLFMSVYSGSVDEPAVIVTDISGAREGTFEEVATLDTTGSFSEEDRTNFFIAGHSISVSPDGTRGYLAYWGGTFLVLDTSDIASGVPDPELRLVTPLANRPTWPNPATHSAVKVPGSDVVITTEELYGDYDDVNDPPGNSSGCPWGWARLIDISDEVRPVVVGEYQVVENTEAYCRSLAGQDPDNTTYTSYSTHNLTVLPKVAFISWHAAGLQAVSIADPSRPVQAGFFVPEPLRSVTTEDPALSRGVNRVVMWSYPIIRKGLIYVVDIRNGLYILRYTGPNARAVADIAYLEGNSNRGDALRLEQG
ncbi:MAG TPA: hypothetical protein VNO79_16890 [Actinomycetota bacterium]|nr:hypothetical protein [Actinomycetota bacterium]